jgi:hypothetical protein
MALKINQHESAVGSQEEMRVQVMFRHSSDMEAGGNNDSNHLNEILWLADSIGDLPCTGDFIILPDAGTEGDASRNGYKIIRRYIDFEPFVKNGGRIVCTILVEPSTAN